MPHHRFVFSRRSCLAQPTFAMDITVNFRSSSQLPAYHCQAALCASPRRQQINLETLCAPQVCQTKHCNGLDKGCTCSPACQPCGLGTPLAWSAQSLHTSCHQTCPPGSRPKPAVNIRCCIDTLSSVARVCHSCSNKYPFLQLCTLDQRCRNLGGQSNQSFIA